MTKNEGDRRVQRTRHLLQEAFVELILEKGYANVTIQDILDRANVGRSTFYVHYRDKEDLLASLFESLHGAFEEHAKLGAQVNLPLIIMQYVEQEHRLFKALLGKKSAGIHLNDMREYLLRSIRIGMKTYSKAKLPAYQFEAVAQYMVNAFLALLVWWIDNDMPCSVDELNNLMMRLMEPGLIDVLQIPSLWPSPTRKPQG